MYHLHKMEIDIIIQVCLSFLSLKNLLLCNTHVKSCEVRQTTTWECELKVSEDLSCLQQRQSDACCILSNELQKDLQQDPTVRSATFWGRCLCCWESKGKKQQRNNAFQSSSQSWHFYTFPVLNIRKPVTATLNYFEWMQRTFVLCRWCAVMWVDVLLQMWWWMKGIWMCESN